MMRKFILNALLSCRMQTKECMKLKGKTIVYEKIGHTALFFLAPQKINQLIT